MSSDLTLYVVYCRPRDFPEEWVVRRHFVKGGICWVDRELFARGDTLAAVRRALPVGLSCIGREPGDDGAIFECWV
jgi:hypothetical protein